MRRTSTGISAITRSVASLALLAGLIGVPLVVVGIVGVPRRNAISSAVDTGRLDDAAITQIGLVVFLLMWAWFAATAVVEAVRIAASRGGRRGHRLAPVSATPSGWVKRTVRLAMLGTTSLVGTGLLSAGVGQRAVTAAVAEAAPLDLEWSADTARPPASGLVSSGRDTPYSIAVRLGDPTLRDRIIALNRGTELPDGTTWTTGVFPRGMPIAVPDGALAPQRREWISYTVVEGDSVYRIASRIATDSTRVRDIADEIIARNTGKPMNDGTLFEDPSLIRIGWQIEIPDIAAEAGPVGHVVEAGESYWSIAEDRLASLGEPVTGPAVAELTDELIRTNRQLLGHDIASLIVPGDELRWPPIEVVVPPPAEPEAPPDDGPPTTVPPTTVPSTPAPPSTASPTSTPVPTTTVSVASEPPIATGDGTETEDDSHRGFPLVSSLGAAILLCAGALGLVESRRRFQLRRAPVHARLEPPSERDVEIERLLRTLPAPERALRLDLALRSAGHHLSGTGAHVGAVTMTDTGTVTLLLHRPEHAAPAAPWRLHSNPPGSWLLADSIDTDELVDSARLAGQPCPALVHLGTLVDGTEDETALFVDLEAFGLLSVEADDVSTHEVIDAIAASLAASPIGETLRLVTHALPIQTHLGNLNAESAETIDAAIDCAASALGSMPTAVGGRRTFELRSRGVGGEAWEPVVVVSGGSRHDPDALRDLIAVTRGGGRGLAAVLAGPVEGAGLRLIAGRSGWLVEPLGLRVVPVGLPDRQVHAVHDLLDAADRPLAIDDHEMPTVGEPRPFVEPPWQLVVHVLGHVSVCDRDGAAVEFERGKALELTAWLALHRDRPTRSAARTALWDQAVRDATFANVVSDARRTMARTVAPPKGEDWIERTLTDQLPLHPLVVTDADLLRARLDAARSLPVPDAIELLRPGVELISDMPFAGTNYLWPDAEGITSSLTLLATAAATELAQRCLAVDDIDGVFWATGKGLRVLAGHEELIGLRMRAYARRGDLAGVRGEWEVYERSIHADPWSNGEPSPKLMAIRRELLSH